MSEVTRILSQLEHGDPHAAEKLLPLVYEELRKLAAAKLAKERAGQTLQATALVHEAYVRLVSNGGVDKWDNRGHFFAAAAEAMRRILVEQARRKQAGKRGGGGQRVPLDEGVAIELAEDARVLNLVALDEALTQLEASQPEKARLVKLRFFTGVPLEDAAALLGISPATAKRYWIYARSWLYGKLEDANPTPQQAPGK
jgi:RNA polymerase sigma factor (TIGR02999 family)